MGNKTREPVDVLFLIRARLDSGTMYGAPQLAKDRRVLERAAAEIERLRDPATIRAAAEAMGMVYLPASGDA